MAADFSDFSESKPGSAPYNRKMISSIAQAFKSGTTTNSNPIKSPFNKFDKLQENATKILGSINISNRAISTNLAKLTSITTRQHRATLSAQNKLFSNVSDRLGMLIKDSKLQASRLLFWTKASVNSLRRLVFGRIFDNLRGGTGAVAGAASGVIGGTGRKIAGTAKQAGSFLSRTASGLGAAALAGGPYILAIGAIVGIVYWMYDNWEKFNTTVNRVGRQVKKWIPNLTKNLKDWFLELPGKIWGSLSNISFKMFIPRIGDLPLFGRFRVWISELITNIRDGIVMTVSKAMSIFTFEEVVESDQGAFGFVVKEQTILERLLKSSLFTTVFSRLESIYNVVISGTQHVISVAGSYILSPLKVIDFPFFKRAGKWFSDAWSVVSEGIKSIRELFISSSSERAKGIGGFFGQTSESEMANFHLPSLPTFESLKSWIKEKWISIKGFTSRVREIISNWVTRSYHNIRDSINDFIRTSETPNIGRFFGQVQEESFINFSLPSLPTFADVKEWVQDKWESLTTFIGMLRGKISEWVSKTYNNIYFFVSDLIERRQERVEGIGGFFGQLTEERVINFTLSTMPSFGNVKDWIKDKWSNVTGFISNIQTTISEWVGRTYTNIRNVINDLVRTSEAPNIGAFFGQVQEEQSIFSVPSLPSFDSVKFWIKEKWTGLTEFVSNLRGKISGWVSKTYNNFLSFLNGFNISGRETDIGGFFGQSIDSSATGLSLAFLSPLPTFEDVKTWIKDKWNNVTDFISNIRFSISTWVSSSYSNIVKFISGLRHPGRMADSPKGSEVESSLHQGIQFTSLILPDFTAVKEWIRKKWNSILNFISNVKSTISEWVVTSYQALKNTINDFIRTTETPNIGQFFGQTQEETVGFVLPSFPSFDNVKSWIRDKWDSITSFISNLRGKISGWISSTYNNFLSLISGFSPKEREEGIGGFFGKSIDSSVSSLTTPPSLPTFKNMKIWISDKWSGLKIYMSDVRQSISTWISESYTNIVDYIRRTISPTTNTDVQYFAGIELGTPSPVSYVQTISAILSSIISSFTTWISEKSSTTLEFLGRVKNSVLSWISTAASDVVTFIKELFRPSVAFVEETAVKADSPRGSDLMATDDPSFMTQLFESILSPTLTWIGEKSSKVWDFLKRAKNSVVGWLNMATTKVFNIIKISSDEIKPVLSESLISASSMFSAGGLVSQENILFSQAFGEQTTGTLDWIKGKVADVGAFLLRAKNKVFGWVGRTTTNVINVISGIGPQAG